MRFTDPGQRERHHVLGSGANTVNAGGGVNVDFTGGGTDMINSTATDTINGAVGGKAGPTIP